MKKLVYVILVSPDVPRGYLGLESDEDEPCAVPPRTANVDLALRFDTLLEANDALHGAAARYQSHSFRVDLAQRRAP